MEQSIKLVVVGTSLGGMRALEAIFCALMRDFPLPIAVVQHRGTDGAQSQLAAVLQRHCALPVGEADDKEPIVGGRVYLAPSDYHLLVEEEGRFALSVDERVSYARPSIDVLFESAAEAYRRALVAVLLTGANTDGTRGARRVRDLGGIVVAQDPRTAESPVMPQAAIHAGAVDRVLPLDEIAAYLNVTAAPPR